MEFKTYLDLNRDDLINITKCEFYLASVLESLKESECHAQSAIPAVALLHDTAPFRVYELAWSAIHLLKQGRIVSAAILSRSVGETVSIIFALQRYLETCLKSSNTIELNDKAKQLLFGFREFRNIDEKLPTAVNILTQIQKMNVIVPEFSELYGQLSEYCHPNSAGFFACFATTKDVSTNINEADPINGSMKSLRLCMTITTVFLRVCLAQCVKLLKENKDKISIIKQRSTG